MAEQLITWSADLEMGIGPIDEQHRVLVDILNEFYAVTQQHLGQEAGEQILGRLADYTHSHFAIEEGIMENLKYPKLGEHKKLHEELLGTLRDLVAKYETGKRSANFELIHFLKLWLVNHIQKSDREYSEYFSSHDGLTEREIASAMRQAGQQWQREWNAATAS